MVLLGATEIKIPEQKTFQGLSFPYVLSPTHSGHGEFRNVKDVTAWVDRNLTQLKDLLKQFGAVLFRDFPITNPEDFDCFVKSFGFESFPYVGGAAPRRVITGNVFTSNEAPPSELIPFHHEMAQVPEYPKVIYFYCDLEPSEGGETPLVVSNMIYQKMLESHPEFVARLEKEGVRYIRVLPHGDDPKSPIGRGWQSTYQTEDKAEATKRAEAQGTEIEWLPNGCLKTVTNILPAIRVDERTGKKTWFNSIIAAYTGWEDCRNDRKKAVTFGNGEQMPEDCMDALEKALDEISVAFR